jgi:superkiller protein 3
MFISELSLRRTLASGIGFVCAIIVSECFVTACGMQFKTSTDYLVSGNEYFKTGDYVKAEQEYRQALKLDPKSAIAESNLGVILGEVGRLDEAIATLQRALELDPKNAVAHYVLAEALIKKGHVDEALSQARTAVKLSPAEAAAYRALAHAALARGDASLAVEASNSAVKLDSDNSVSHEYLGQALFSIGDLESAQMEEKKALDLDAENNEARLQLTAMQNMTGKKNKTASAEQVPTRTRP